MSESSGIVKNGRRSRRQAPKTSIRVCCFRGLLGLGPNIAAGLLDVSQTGIRLLLSANVPVGQEIDVVLETVASRQIKARGQVVWVVPTSDGKVCVGVAFIKPLGYADLQLVTRT
jgi:hypothetical protein